MNNPEHVTVIMPPNKISKVSVMLVLSLLKYSDDSYVSDDFKAGTNSVLDSARDIINKLPCNNTA